MTGRIPFSFYPKKDRQPMTNYDVILDSFAFAKPLKPQRRRLSWWRHHYSSPPNPGMHCIAYLELGLKSAADSLFPRAYGNIQQPFNVWTETPTGGERKWKKEKKRKENEREQRAMFVFSWKTLAFYTFPDSSKKKKPDWRNFPFFLENFPFQKVLQISLLAQVASSNRFSTDMV